MKNCAANSICESIVKYVSDNQEFSPGEYYGSFWSEKAYHGPLLDWHGGGSHHHRGAGSAALLLWETGKKNNDDGMMRNAEAAFDWLVARQHERGGWFEIQNNEKPSDWEGTGLDEVSTISSAFVIHGLGRAILQGLPSKKIYMDCLEKAGHWFLSIEWPAGSGIFPHHERSPYDTLNATAHSVESLALIFQCLSQIYKKRSAIFLEGARRGFAHALPLQWENGCYPYRRNQGSTINYTALVLWCFLNALEVLSEKPRIGWPEQKAVKKHFDKAASFLLSCIDKKGALKWEDNETSTAKHNVWTYAIAANTLNRIGGKANNEGVRKILKYLAKMKTQSGLPPMRDEGEEITECLFMQADTGLFLKDLKGV